MNRKEKVLYKINKSEKGLEIGPSHQPIASKQDGYNVHVLDHLNKHDLIEKYKSHDVDISKIEDVDFVWSGEPYDELTGNNAYDWIIASHVIEHTPDLISFINNCESVLKEDGVLSLAIPDKRYCFDHFRPLTSLSAVIDRYNLISPDKHTEGSISEYHLNIVKKSSAIAWSSHHSGEYTLFEPTEESLKKINCYIQSDEYIDIHSWCCVPHSFRLLIRDLNQLGYISLQEVQFFNTDGCEFYMTLGRQGSGMTADRLDILKTIELEINEGSKIVEAPSKSKSLLYYAKKSIKKLLAI